MFSNVCPFRMYRAEILPGAHGDWSYTCQKLPRGGNFTREHIWTFDIEYVTQNKRSSWLRTHVHNAIRVFYDYSQLRALLQINDFQK